MKIQQRLKPWKYEARFTWGDSEKGTGTKSGTVYCKDADRAAEMATTACGATHPGCNVLSVSVRERDEKGPRIITGARTPALSRPHTAPYVSRAPVKKPSMLDVEGMELADDPLYGDSAVRTLDPKAIKDAIASATKGN